jgi:outer membrane protein assembly factor BamB
MPYREQEMLAETDRSIPVVATNGKVRGLDRTSGAIRWSNDLTGGGIGSVFVAFRFGVLAVSALGAKVFRLDYATGATLWEAETSGGGGRAAIVIEPDLMFVAKAGQVDAFDHDGIRLWTQPLRGLGLSGVALGFSGNLAQADEAT